MKVGEEVKVKRLEGLGEMHCEGRLGQNRRPNLLPRFTRNPLLTQRAWK